MITIATLVRDSKDIFDLFGMIERNMPCNYEVVIGDNSTDEALSIELKEFADEYIYIKDKQFFRMGIPWCHNLLNSIANTYKIFYVDSDEYPVWIHPEIEERFDINYVLPTLRYDFFTKEQINFVDKKIKDFQEIMEYCNGILQVAKFPERISIQDRIYNSRYVQFDGVCHSVFHVPQHFRAAEAGAIYMHNQTVREAKDKDRMDKLIDEQFARQNVNFMLASSENVLRWGRGVKHKFNDWKEWYEAYASQK